MDQDFQPFLRDFPILAGTPLTPGIGIQSIDICFLSKISTYTSNRDSCRIPANFREKNYLNQYSIVHVNTRTFRKAQFFKELKGLEIYDQFVNLYSGFKGCLTRHAVYLEDFFETEHLKELTFGSDYYYVSKVDIEHKWIQAKVKEIGYQKILSDLDNFTNYLPELYDDHISGVTYPVELYFSEKGKPLAKPTAAQRKNAKSQTLYLTFLKDHTVALKHRQRMFLLQSLVNRELRQNLDAKPEDILSISETELFNRYFVIKTDSFLWDPLQLVRFNDKALNQFYANEGVCCVVSKEEFTTSEVQRILELYEQHKNSIHAIDTIVKKPAPGEKFIKLPDDEFFDKEQKRIRIMRTLFDMIQAVKQCKKQYQIDLANDPTDENREALVYLLHWMDRFYDPQNPLALFDWFENHFDLVANAPHQVSKQEIKFVEDVVPYLIEV